MFTNFTAQDKGHHFRKDKKHPSHTSPSATSHEPSATNTTILKRRAQRINTTSRHFSNIFRKTKNTSLVEDVRRNHVMLPKRFKLVTTVLTRGGGRLCRRTRNVYACFFFVQSARTSECSDGLAVDQKITKAPLWAPTLRCSSCGASLTRSLTLWVRRFLRRQRSVSLKFDQMWELTTTLPVFVVSLCFFSCSCCGTYQPCEML